MWTASRSARTSYFLLPAGDLEYMVDNPTYLLTYLPTSHFLLPTGDLEYMVDNPQFSDVGFIVEGRTVHAHKFILFARSEYFRRMFTSGDLPTYLPTYLPTRRLTNLPTYRHTCPPRSLCLICVFSIWCSWKYFNSFVVFQGYQKEKEFIASQGI